MKNKAQTSINKIFTLIILEIFLLSQMPFPVFSFPDGKSGSDTTITAPAAEIQVTHDSIKENSTDTYSRKVFRDSIAILTFNQVMLEIPEGAVTEPVTITIEELADTEELNPGMSNMTAGARGYRFKPDGMKFEKDITVTLPYDTDMIRTEEDYISLYTYFYNEDAGYWQRLERVGIDKEKGCVTSLTNHFTDLINSTLTLPESPTPLHFNSTSIKDIKAADPGAGINLIEPPQANNQGSANLRFPIEVPPGRNGLQAQAAVQYNSDGGNGWMGLGWDISFSGISIDTRWGVPRYSDDNETETYVLDGAQLAPLAHRGELVDREPDKEFHTRIEGEFRKIMRRGDNPNNYWWEVTDKNGTRFFYGGLPEQGMLANAVLAGGTIVEDTGIGTGEGGGGENGTVMGRQLYAKTIRYTGTVGNPGSYFVTFIRDRELGEGRRPDVSIDGRAGFKVVTADLLKKVEVAFDDTIIRSYEFVYETGAFEKTLLKAIVQYGEDGEEFHRHAFSYYDEVRNDSTYHAFSDAETWNLGSDNVNTSLLYYDVGSGIGLNRSTGENKHLYVGAGVGYCSTKNNTAGFKIGHSTNEAHGSLAFIDIDGDSLPDKLFNDNGTIYFQKQRLQESGQSTFDIAREVINLHEISKDNTTTTSAGAESYFLANIMANYSTSVTTGSNYFSDVNSDGLIDFVESSQVLFNHIEDGIPVFTPDSGDTPHPVVAGAADTDGIIQGLENLYEEMIDNNPLIDSVRVWTAPFSGTVTISAPVNLVPINTEEREKYTTADGVRVAIQKGSQELWQTDIDAEDYSVKIPHGVDSVQVSAGEKIYFRVQSVFDGSFDIVNWHPEITYINEETKLDANLMDIYSYDSNRDFVLAGRKGDITVPIGGNIAIEGVLDKTGITSDDIRLCVSKNDQTIIEEFISWNTETAIMINETFHVDAQDKIQVSLFIDSPVDLGHISWTSKLSYVSSDNPDIEVIDVQGNSLFTYIPLTNIDIYSNPVGTGAYTGVVMPLTGNITVSTGFTPFLQETMPPNVNGNIVFTIKKRRRIGKKVVHFD